MSQLKYICIHWTAGGLVANAIDRRCYHFIVQGDGSIVAGVHKPEANAQAWMLEESGDLVGQ